MAFRFGLLRTPKRFTAVTSKSIVVKEAIELYLTQRKKSKNPFEAGADLFGQEGSGSKNNSVSYKKKLKELLREKHAH